MITLAITHYDRYQLLTESFKEVADDPRLTEILIVDDCSDLDVYNKVILLERDYEKVRVIRQARNRGMMRNKREAIALSKNDWVIIFDSDNIIKPAYLDAVAGVVYEGWAQPYVFYLPSFAFPNFDYRHFEGQMISKTLLKHLSSEKGPYLSDSMFWCMLNTCNMLVNKHEYIRVFEDNPAIKETDTLWMNYLWLKAGNQLMVVPDLHYFHRVHKGSGWMQNANYNMGKAEELKELIIHL